MGYEYITQPQIFLAPVTATYGFENAPPAYPLITSFQSWTSSNPEPKSVWPIPGTWLLDINSSAFIVSIGGVLQSPLDYTVQRIPNRRITFSAPVCANTEIAVTQIATHAPSSQFFNYLQADSAFITDLTSNTFTYLTTQNIIQALTSATINSLTSIDGFITNLTTVNVYNAPSAWAINLFSPLIMGINSPETALTLTQAGTANYLTIIDPSDDKIIFTINKNNTVGVGVSAPTETLEVKGNLKVVGPSDGNIIADNELIAPKLVVNQANINSLFVDGVTATSVDYYVTEISSDSKVFTNLDNSKSYHFNTTNNLISAIFPQNLPNGFNVSIVNTGTNTIYISSAQTPFLNATGFINETQYTGMFIYKSEGLLYGVGVFE
jgi:hypothetical protein